MKLIGRISADYHVDNKSHEYAEHEGVVYLRLEGEKKWKVDRELTEWRRVRAEAMNGHPAGRGLTQ